VSVQQLSQETEAEQRRDTSPEAVAARRAVMVRAALGEFLCTFLFFFSVCGASLNLKRAESPNKGELALATGFCAVALIFSFADISGAHFNPAVTFACWLAKKTSNRKLLLYVLSQILGGIFAMLALKTCFENNLDELAIEPPENESLGRVFMMELILTFILVFVIFTVAFENLDSKKKVQTFRGAAGAYGLTLYTASPQSKTGFAPIAIGLTIGYLTLIGGTVSGGAFNPARVFAAAAVTNKWGSHWIYWLADFLGAAIAAGFSTLFSRFGASAVVQRPTSQSVAPGQIQLGNAPYSPPNPRLTTSDLP